jgi:hypothetical protein
LGIRSGEKFLPDGIHPRVFFAESFPLESLVKCVRENTSHTSFFLGIRSGEKFLPDGIHPRVFFAESFPLESLVKCVREDISHTSFFLGIRSGEKFLPDGNHPRVFFEVNRMLYTGNTPDEDLIILLFR